jgi:steroid 5-alpha reductase family enzyme
MWRLVIFLIFTLIVVPLVTFQFDEPLNELQQHILQNLVIVYAVSAAAVFLVSTISRNYSQVDKIWSVIPIVYAWMIAHGAGYETRIVLMAVLVSLWGIRLTWNFNRKGGYSWKFWTGEEDYRWAILRQKPEFQAPWKWMLFNLFFISAYQMGLLLIITLPLLKAIGGTEVGMWDYIIAGAFLLFLYIETVSDNQQWDFQTEKYRRINAGEELTEPYKKGFLDSGMFSWSRHPNFMAEQAMWIVLYLFTIPATGKWINWSIAGALLIVLLFQGSVNFTEEISAGKYPEYKDYQKRVGKLLPGIGKRR